MTTTNSDPFAKFKAAQREAWAAFGPVEISTTIPPAKLVKFAQVKPGQKVLERRLRDPSRRRQQPSIRQQPEAQRRGATKLDDVTVAPPVRHLHERRQQVFVAGLSIRRALRRLHRSEHDADRVVADIRLTPQARAPKIDRDRADSGRFRESGRAWNRAAARHRVSVHGRTESRPRRRLRAQGTCRSGAKPCGRRKADADEPSRLHRDSAHRERAAGRPRGIRTELCAAPQASVAGDRLCRH